MAPALLARGSRAAPARPAIDPELRPLPAGPGAAPGRRWVGPVITAAAVAVLLGAASEVPAG